MMWIVTGVLLLLASGISSANWACVVQGLRGRGHSSWIPLVGGMLGAAGCWLAPDGALLKVWWVPFIVDFGSAPGLVVTLGGLLLRKARQAAGRPGESHGAHAFKSARRRGAMAKGLGVEFGGAWWSMTLRPGWSGRHDAECATITRRDGGGTLQVSAARKDGVVTDEDLGELAEDLVEGARGVPVQCGGFAGLEYHSVRDGQAWIQWFVRSGSTVVFATYVCAATSRGADDQDVHAMLASLRLPQR